MNLYIDIGNSRIKWLFSDEDSSRSATAFDYREQTLEKALQTVCREDWQKQSKPEAVYVANVLGGDASAVLDELCESLWQLGPCYACVSEQCLGIKNGYLDIQQLGVDRWLAIIAAWYKHRKDVLIVDCGTALTIDAVKVLEADTDSPVIAEHQGGLIIPGIRMMNEILVDKTVGIGKADFKANKKTPVFARSTAEGLYHGSIRALTAAIEKSYQQFQSQCNDKILCILTGGSAPTIMSELEIDSDHDPDLVLRGLKLWSQLK